MIFGDHGARPQTNIVISWRSALSAIGGLIWAGIAHRGIDHEDLLLHIHLWRQNRLIDRLYSIAGTPNLVLDSFNVLSVESPRRKKGPPALVLDPEPHVPAVEALKIVRER